jgi:hypothetical protein
MAKSGKPRGIVLRYGYRGFWFGSAVLGGLGAMMVLPGINLALNPPPPTPGKPGPTAGMGFILVAVGAVFAALGGLLAWLAVRWSGRFEADAGGIRWWRGGKFQRELRWADARRIRLPHAGGWLAIEGPEDTPPLEVSTVYKDFDEFLKRLRIWVDWDALTRPDAMQEQRLLAAEGRSAGASGLSKKPRAGTSSSAPVEIPKLPLVFQRVLGVRLALFGTVLFGVLTVILWSQPTANAPGPEAKAVREKDDAKAKREREKDEVTFQVFKYLCPLLCILSAWGALTTWTRYTVDEEGLALRYLVYGKRYDWDELTSVEVGTRKASETGPYQHTLVIGLRGRGKWTLPFGDLSFAYRDAMVAAAESAGVRLCSR